MPYTSLDKLPDNIKDKPKHVQEIFMQSFNSAHAKYKDDQRAFAIAYAAVDKYERGGKKLNEYKTVSPVLLTDGELVDIQLLRTGHFHHKMYGQFDITDNTIDEILQNKGKNDKPIDVEHLSEMSTDPEKSKAVGWIKELYKKATDKGAELWARVDWTDTGRKYIQDESFKYMSAVYDPEAVSKESGKTIGARLKSAGLTNSPFIEGMAPVMCSDNIDLSQLIYVQEGNYTTDGEREVGVIDVSTISADDNVDVITYDFKEADAMRDKLLELFEFDDKENATDEQILECVRLSKEGGERLITLKEKYDVPSDSDIDTMIDKLKKELDKSQEEIKALGLKEDETTVKLNELNELQEKVIELSDKVKAGEEAQQKLREMEAKAKVDAAVNEKKVTPAMSEWALNEALTNPEGFDKYLECATPHKLNVTPIGDETTVTPSPDRLLSEKAREIQKERNVEFRQALILAKEENPDLAKEVQEARDVNRRPAK